MNAKNIVITILALILIGAISYLIMNSGGDTVVVVEDSPNTIDTAKTETTELNDEQQKASDQPIIKKQQKESVIGTSVEGTDILAYHFGTGDKEILLIGGVHGSYSPNTTSLASEFISYFEKNEATIPANLTVTIIPNLNPDGATKSGATGRFNANNVDLNRNFDCEWSAKAVWKNEEVSGGTKAFSEPEAIALRDYVEQHDPVAAVVWFSAEGKVYPSACNEKLNKASIELANTFASAAKYKEGVEFDSYAITGDMVNWMAKQSIPAISVLLSDYKNTEWQKNEAGVKAVLAKYAE
jgi:hypothetical protein